LLADDPSHQRLLGDRIREMGRGKKVSLAAVKRLHKQLIAGYDTPGRSRMTQTLSSFCFTARQRKGT